MFRLQNSPRPPEKSSFFSRPRESPGADGGRFAPPRARFARALRARSARAPPGRSAFSSSGGVFLWGPWSAQESAQKRHHGGECVKTSGFPARLFTKGGGRKNRVFLKKIRWKYRSGPIAGGVPSSEKWSSHHRPLLGPISLFPYEACVCSRLFFHREKTRYMRVIIGPPPFFPK